MNTLRILADLPGTAERRGRIGLFEERRAVFSDCGRYRYLLEAIWAGRRGTVAFVLLNPSDASHVRVDPTNTRGRGFADAWGYGGLRFVNLFAWRDRHPKAMMEAADPVGPANDAAILAACRNSEITVCAWGAHGHHRGRSAAVTALLQNAGIALHALRWTRGGEPEHPLYLPGNLRPVPWVPSGNGDQP